MTVPVVRLHDNAVITAVTGIGRPVGYAEAPAGARDAVAAGTGDGYYIVYPIPGGDRDGPVTDPHTDIELVYQITCIDRGPEGVRWLTDQLEVALAAVTVTGRNIMWIRPSGSPSGVWRDDDTAEPSMFFSAPTFRLATTPT